LFSFWKWLPIQVVNLPNHTLQKRAFILGELKETKRSLAQKDEAIKQLEERLQRLEVTHDRTNHSNHGSRHSHRHSSRSSSTSHGHEEESGRRRHRHHHEDRRQHVAKPYFLIVKLPSFSGDGDPNVYLDWEAKVEQIFHVQEVLEDQRVGLASLEFLDYAMQWWHKTLMDIGLNKRPPVVSWNDLKECMRARFVPPPSRNEHFLMFQRLPQGHRIVDEYFKDFETTLTKMNMHANEESKIKWFVSGLRREIKDFVKLHEYFEKVVPLAIKVESHLLKTTLKNTHDDGFYKSSRKDANKISTQISSSNFSKTNHFSKKSFYSKSFYP